MKAPFKTINEELKKNKIFFDSRFNSDYDFLLHYFKITQPKKILIAGGLGLIGSTLISKLNLIEKNSFSGDFSQ